MKTGQKQERINEARFIKHYVLERKKKLKQEKEEKQKKKIEKHLSSIREDLEARNEILDQKYRNQKVKIRDKKNSLPSISGKATHALLLKLPGEEWRNKSPKHYGR